MSRLFVTVAGRRWEFTPGQDVVIGRDPGCAIVIDDPRVSRSHLALRHNPGAGWVAEDAGSTGGMFVSGERLTRVAVERRIEVRLSNPGEGPLITLEPEAVGAPGLSPGAAPAVTVGPPPGQFGAGPVTPGPIPGQYGPGVPGPRPAPVAVLGLVLVIAGCVAAVLGAAGSFVAFGRHGYETSQQTFDVLTSLGRVLGLSAIAVAAGSYLRLAARR